MKTRIGINGFGRSGRQAMKAIFERYPDSLEVVAINDIGDPETMAWLFSHDSNYGTYPGTVEVRGDKMIVDGDKQVQILAERNPGDLPWGDLKVALVLESTGLFKQREKAALHIKAGAKKVVIGYPSPDADVTLVLGVNQDWYDPKKHTVVSMASCTTNCTAPVAKVLVDNFGIVKGSLTTVHAYTSNQRLLDGPDKDLRRARAAGLNMIPTTTGAAKATALVVPELGGKLSAMAFRVPTTTVSVIDFVVEVERPTTAKEVNDAMRAAAEGPMKGILAISEEPLVSIDFKGSTYSSTVDAPLTSVVGGNLVKIISWYDNEWGYSTRLADLSEYLAEKGI
jgi:glyceraldehyde 3-phosphate dehydrogenase